MKSFFEIKNFYNDDAVELDGKLHDILGPIVDEFISRGYNPREISYLISQVGNDITMEKILLTRSEASYE